MLAVQTMESAIVCQVVNVLDFSLSTHSSGLRWFIFVLCGGLCKIYRDEKRADLVIVRFLESTAFRAILSMVSDKLSALAVVGS